MLFVVALLGALSTVSYAQAPIWAANGCGKSKYSDAGEMNLPSGLIVGGQQAQPYEFPWQASYRRKSSNSHFCGGIILNERWILTAAHCSDGETPSAVSIVVGDWQRSNSSSTVRQTLDVELIKMHESYNSKTYANDVSLVKVAKDIVFSDDVQPVCAPEPTNNYTYYKSQCAGWGTLSSGGSCCPDILQYVTLNVTTNAYCGSVYGNRYTISADMVCATDNSGSNQRDSCQGDSGGPLTIKEADGTFRIIGVVSWGIGCASGYPGVYARVSYFSDWITNFIANN